MQLTPTREMPRRRAAGGRNPRPIKTTDEGRAKMPYVLMCSDAHQKTGQSKLAWVFLSGFGVRTSPSYQWRPEPETATWRVLAYGLVELAWDNAGKRTGSSNHEFSG